MNPENAGGTRGRSRLSRIVRQVEQPQPVEITQPVETSQLNTIETSTRETDPRETELREAAAQVEGRFLKAEAWLDCHEEDHPQYQQALDRLHLAILGMSCVEEEARELGIENIFGEQAERSEKSLTAASEQE